MRKEVTKKLLAIFIASIMVLSVLGFVLNYIITPEVYKFNKYIIKATPKGFELKALGKKFLFNFLPDQLVQFELKEANFLLNASEIAITYNPEDSEVNLAAEAQFYFEDLAKDLWKIKRGLIKFESPFIQEISCENATKETPVVEILSHNASLYEIENFCLKIKFSNQNDLIGMIEKLIYFKIGVIK